MDYTEWMDGPGGYREWWEARYGENAGEGDAQPLSGGGPGDPPPPPKKY